MQTLETLKESRDEQSPIYVTDRAGMVYQGVVERIICHGTTGQLAIKLDTTKGWVYL